MIQIFCPNNNIPERTYSIEALFVDVLGCSYDTFSIQFSNAINNYELDFGSCKVIIEDHFFNRYKEPLSYLNTCNLPKGLSFFHALGLELPIIYGEDKFERKDSCVVVGLDIFASTFFMLTRWEESLLGREEKGDCDESQLFCVKQGIHQRPIVNEYADFIRQLLPSGISLLTRNYDVILAHDVDGFIAPSWTSILKHLASQTIHGAPKKKSSMTWWDDIEYKFTFPSAYSQFEMYTNLSEKYNIREWFFIKVCGRGEKEATYFYNNAQTKKNVRNLKEMNNKNCVLGFHPSQNVIRNEEQWSRELDRITGLLQEKPIIGRNHHLLFNHEILRLWESVSDSTMKISNCVFHRRIGFRSGVCVPYRLFDLYQRRVMHLIEYPCQIMDTEIRFNKDYEIEENLWLEVKDIISQVKKYSGCLVLTWHIYVRKKQLILDYFDRCEKTIQYAVSDIII